MATKHTYFGRHGRFDHDDTDSIDDGDGLFPGLSREAIVTDGQLVVGGGPTLDHHVVRLIDLLTAIAGLVASLHTHTPVPYQDAPTVTSLRDALITLGLMEPATSVVGAGGQVLQDVEDQVFQDDNGQVLQDG